VDIKSSKYAVGLNQENQSRPSFRINKKMLSQIYKGKCHRDGRLCEKYNI